MMWDWHSGWAWWWMGLGMVLFWGLLALVVVLVVRLGRTGSERGGARRILDERYARGEIDDDEYRRRSDVIRS
jgi:putative membrane protein